MTPFEILFLFSILYVPTRKHYAQLIANDQNLKNMKIIRIKNNNILRKADNATLAKEIIEINAKISRKITLHNMKSPFISVCLYMSLSYIFRCLFGRYHFTIFGFSVYYVYVFLVLILAFNFIYLKIMGKHKQISAPA